MSLPSPSLDDRSFQDLVDEAKRRVARRCPEWTDHNVSDPGVALIEVFAWMTDMFLYRLDQVPDALFTRFLDLMGIELFTAAAATADLTFWLSAPQDDPVTVPEGTQVGTVRTRSEEAVVFMTDRDLTIRPPTLGACLAATADGRFVDQWDELRSSARAVTCFADGRPGDAVVIGFEESLGGNVLRLEVEASVEGVGVDPQDPPWVWEVWDGEQWSEATVHRDTTNGLNTDGAIDLLLPADHEPLALGSTRQHWVRCRMLEAREGQSPYIESPQLLSLSASTLGGVVSGHHARRVRDERLGRSDGTPGQRMAVRRRPVLPRRPGETVVVTDPDGEQVRWQEVEDFVDSAPDDHHFTLDGVSGEVRFGPEVRGPDGTVRRYGAVPPEGATVTMSAYRHGGGTGGNVGAGTLTVLKSSIPFVAGVENLMAARGGVDPETVENAKRRGPMSLRTGQRAVTAGDFERLTLEASPEVARARCLPPDEDGHAVRVLVVPRLQLPPRELALDDLALTDALVDRVSSHLDQRRILTTTVGVGTPSYQGVTVVSRVRSSPGSQPDRVRERVTERLYEYVNPLTGGPEGTGWPFERDLNVGELFALLSGLEGVTGVEEVLVFPADLRTGERGDPRQRISLPPDALFASYEHQVMVR